jgi:formamidopyrimidine-DNA glycosylase
VPELPDITVYLDAIRPRVMGSVLGRMIIRSPFLLRTVVPTPESAEGRRVSGVSRLGKRIVIELEGDVFLVVHLMISGRFRWKEAGARPAGKIDLAAFGFDAGTLVLTEASQKKRASLHITQGRHDLLRLAPYGLDVLASGPAEFAAALRRENHTLKRTLTDPRIIDGIGNAYSDEILHAARLSPVKLSQSLSDSDAERLHSAARETLGTWIGRLRHEFGMDGEGPGRFPGPGDITAFRPDFAVHGRFGKPCPVCGSPVQRIVYAESETNYCATCQTGGRLLADRSLSRLLKDDWPRTIEELESP